MSDNYHWRLAFSGLDLPMDCTAAFRTAAAKTSSNSEELSGFPAILASEDSFQHILSVGNWESIDSGGDAEK